MASCESAVTTPAQTVPSLRCSFAWTMCGNVLYAACQWGMLSALAKLGSPELVGQYALGLAITAPVFMLTNLALRGVQATDARSEYAFGHYFTLRLIASVLGITAVVGIVFVSGYASSTAAVIVLLAVAKAIESLSDAAAGLLQKHERLDQVAIGLMLKGVSSVTAFATAFMVSHRVVWAVVALIVVWAAVAVGYDLRLASQWAGGVRHFFTGDYKKIARLVSLSLPLGMVMAMLSLSTNVPRYVVEHTLGQRQLGIFAAIAYLVTAAWIVANAMGQSASARLSRMYVAGDLDGFKVLIKKLVIFGASLGVLGIVGGCLFGRQALTLLYGPEYAGYMRAFLFMLASMGMTAIASFLGHGMTAARRLRAQVPVIGATTVTVAALSLLLVPKLGLAGAAVALLGSAAVQSMLSGAVLWKATAR